MHHQEKHSRNVESIMCRVEEGARGRVEVEVGVLLFGVLR
jgi:hypothetical protein